MDKLKRLAEMKKFKTRLLALRKAKKMTRMDLVRNANMSYPTVIAWENETLTRIEAATVDSLLVLLECTLDELIYIVEDE